MCWAKDVFQLCDGPPYARAESSRRRGLNMRRAAVLLAATAVVSLAPLPKVANADEIDGSHHGGGGTVWVANRDKGEVAVFDARSGTLRATISTGSGAHEVAISQRESKAYVTNESENTVSILSTKTLVGRKISLGPRPHHAEVSKDGRAVLVALFDSNRIALIDTDTDDVVQYDTSNDEAARAHSGYLSRDHETIYVPHEIGDQVTGIDVETGAVELSVAGIVQPSEVLPDRSERLLYVSARGEGAIKVIDVASGTIVDEVDVGTQPETMLLTRDRRTLVVTLRGTPATLAFVDTSTMTLVDTVALAGSGTFGDLAAMSRDGRFVYATFDRGQTGIGGVAVVDVKQHAVVDTWDYPGKGRPHGVAYSAR